MKLKTGLFLIMFFSLGGLPCFSQTIMGKAAGDFYSAFAKMGINEKRLTSLDDLTPFINHEVFERLREDLVYRVYFVGFASNQFSLISGVTSSVGFFETLRALAGFLMLIDESGELEEWTIREISNRYEQLIASSWRNVNPPLFTVMLEAYCSYMRGELWQRESVIVDTKR